MITVNSLSGGKTSSYIAANYPADLEVFALVCIDNHNANARTAYKIDAKMRQMVNDKLQKYCSNMPEFVATAEDPLTIKTMFDLEQIIGREIIWVRGIGYDTMINQSSFIPNSRAGKCTTILKIDPIFWLLYLHFSLPCKMRIGYRADESHREETFTDYYKFPIYSQRYNDEKSFYFQNKNYFQRWVETVYRIGEFPLIVDQIFKTDVNQYWQPFIESVAIEFPPDTNCQFCHHKPIEQVKINTLRNESINMWAAVMEDMQGHTFDKNWSILEIQNLAIQQDLFTNKLGAGCKGGYCIN